MRVALQREPRRRLLHVLRARHGRGRQRRDEPADALVHGRHGRDRDVPRGRPGGPVQRPDAVLHVRLARHGRDVRVQDRGRRARRCRPSPTARRRSRRPSCARAPTRSRCAPRTPRASRTRRPSERAFTVDADAPDTTIADRARSTAARPPTARRRSCRPPARRARPSSAGSTTSPRRTSTPSPGRRVESNWDLAELEGGKHTVEVRATDAAGNTDATPAKRTFTVLVCDTEVRFGADRGARRVPGQRRDAGRAGVGVHAADQAQRPPAAGRRRLEDRPHRPDARAQGRRAGGRGHQDRDRRHRALQGRLQLGPARGRRG